MLTSQDIVVSGFNKVFKISDTLAFVYSSPAFTPSRSIDDLTVTTGSISTVVVLSTSLLVTLTPFNIILFFAGIGSSLGREVAGSITSYTTS